MCKRVDVDHHHDDFLGKKSIKSRGNGVVLWFLVDDLNKCVKAAKKLKAKILRDVALNPNAGHYEIWLKDLDGYVVVLADHPD